MVNWALFCPSFFFPEFVTYKFWENPLHVAWFIGYLLEQIIWREFNFADLYSITTIDTKSLLYFTTRGNFFM